MVKIGKKISVLVIASLFICIFTSGCAKTSSPPEEALSIQPVDMAVDGNPDIVLPSDLKQDSKNSMTVRTDSFIC